MIDGHDIKGRFWIGAGGDAPMYVEWGGLESAGVPPIVLVHGGGGQGTDWLGTPDGRPGWAPELIRRGHAVYVIDRPGHGRGGQRGAALGELGPEPTAEGLGVLFRSPHGVHSTAHLQTQWPTDDSVPPGSDAAILQLLSGSRSMPTDLSVAHALERQLGVELLDRVGPAILFTHSAGAPAGWLMAAARPELVRAIVALEPFGPPFRPAADGLPGLPHGLTAIPIEGLTDIPVLLVTAEASLLGHFDTEVREYLSEVGAKVELMRLADHGVHGNGHGMIFESNHIEVLDAVMAELDRLLDATQ
jgi:pimeloyl-ACP methyl ester carboxylesterase